MFSRVSALVLCVLASLYFGLADSPNVSAAPALQLPWPSGVQHHISGGNTYGCGTHQETSQYAIDFSFPIEGTAVATVAAGTVSDSSSQNGDARGNFLEIDHGGGFKSRYLHLRLNQPFAVNPVVGTPVSQGQLIAYSGSTGGVPAHLHFDMKLNGLAVKAEPLSGVTNFGYWGISSENQGNCSGYPNDPSPDWTSTPSSFQGWESWGAYADGSPIAIAYDDARPDFIWEAKRSGGDIFVRRWNPGWTTWQNISNPGSDPVFNGNVAISNHQGTVRVIAQSSSMVYLKQWISGNSWYNWSDVSLGSPVPGSIAISNGPNGRIDIVGVASNKMWIKWYEGGSWYGWQDLSGASPITGTVAVANRGGMTHVVGWAGGRAWLKWKIGATWYGWQDLVSPVDNTFLAIDNANALTSETQSIHHGVHIAALAGGSTWLRCWDIDCAPGWNHLSAPGAGPVAIANDTFEVNVVTKDTGWTLWHKWWGSPHQ